MDSEVLVALYQDLLYCNQYFTYNRVKTLKPFLYIWMITYKSHKHLICVDQESINNAFLKHNRQWVLCKEDKGYYLHCICSTETILSELMKIVNEIKDKEQVLGFIWKRCLHSSSNTIHTSIFSLYAGQKSFQRCSSLHFYSFLWIEIQC